MPSRIPPPDVVGQDYLRRRGTLPTAGTGYGAGGAEGAPTPEHPPLPPIEANVDLVGWLGNASKPLVSFQTPEKAREKQQLAERAAVAAAGSRGDDATGTAPKPDTPGSGQGARQDIRRAPVTTPPATPPSPFGKQGNITVHDKNFRVGVLGEGGAHSDWQRPSEYIRERPSLDEAGQLQRDAGGRVINEQVTERGNPARDRLEWEQFQDTQDVDRAAAEAALVGLEAQATESAAKMARAEALTAAPLAPEIAKVTAAGLPERTKQLGRSDEMQTRLMALQSFQDEMKKADAWETQANARAGNDPKARADAQAQADRLRERARKNYELLLSGLFGFRPVAERSNDILSQLMPAGKTE